MTATDAIDSFMWCTIPRKWFGDNSVPAGGSEARVIRFAPPHPASAPAGQFDAIADAFILPKWPAGAILWTDTTGAAEIE